MMPFEILKNLGKNDSNTTSQKTNLKKKKKKKKKKIKIYKTLINSQKIHW